VSVTLDKDSHIYTSSSGEVYKSVSSLINQFVPFFDFEQKSYDYSAKHGIPVEDVRRSWKEKNKKSTDYGQLIHEQIELNIRKKQFNHNDKIYNDILQSVEKFIIPNSKIYSEQIISNDNFKIAGTSDLIIERKTDFDILDFKTNKKIKFENPFEDKNLLFPVEHLPNAEFFKYALQLSLYAYMHELKTGKKLYRLMIFWFKRKRPEDYSSFEGKWVKYSLPYLKEEIELILDYGSSK
jgi:hypothetical protein